MDGMEVTAVTDAVNLGRICQQSLRTLGRHSPIMKHRLSSAPMSAPMVEQPVGGRPSRNRKRPTDHVGAYPRARAFPAVPPSPPLVMQRHRILSCDGEAARRVLVPQTDFTLHSPSGGRRYESFHTTGTLTRLFIPTGETASPKDEKSARTLETPEGRQGVPKPPSNLRNGRGRPGFEAPGASFFRAREGVGGLRFRPGFRARHSPPTCPQSVRQSESENESHSNFYK